MKQREIPMVRGRTRRNNVGSDAWEEVGCLGIVLEKGKVYNKGDPEE